MKVYLNNIFLIVAYIDFEIEKIMFKIKLNCIFYTL